MDTIEKMLDQKADVDATDECGRTPLALLCRQHWSFLPGLHFPKLAEGCATYPAALFWGFPFDLMPVKGTLIRCALKLLAAGADMNVPDHQGDTPLSLARTSGNSTLILLLEYYTTVQACATLSRGVQQKPPEEVLAFRSSIGQLTGGLLLNVLGFLAPPALQDKLLKIPGFITLT